MIENVLVELQVALEDAQAEYDRAMSAYANGGVVVEYDSDYYEGQVVAYEHAIQLLGGS